VIKRQSPSLVWNYAGRLTAVTTGGTTVSYRYNGDGLLWERTENGTTTRYYCDGTDVIAEGTVGAGATATLKARYVRGNSLITRQGADEQKQYYLQNGHGDVIELRDATGNTRLNQYTYDIWGNPQVIQEQMAQPFRYSGELYDQATGLQYLRSRWYDPSLGRFIQEDTYQGDTRNPLSLNLFTYVENNPLTNVDPSGHYCVSADGNWAHGGECDSAGSIYLGDDSAWQGREIIHHGVVTGQLGTYGPSMPYSGNYWNNHTDDKMIFKEHSLGYTIDSVYGNAHSIPFWDDPMFYIADFGAAVGKGLAKAVGKFIAKQAAKESAELIVDEVANIGSNKIYHILQDKHLWGKVVNDPSDWNQVSAVMSKVITHGAEGPYKSVFMKTLRIGDETVVVTYTRLPNGVLKISDGWVAK
jgi:RHS repeat-associated protein